MLFATSCSNNDLDSAQSGNEGVVTFMVEQPGTIATRAFSDGTTATTLTYAAYETESGKLVAQDEVAAAFSDNKASITLMLKKSIKYDVVFWADAEGAPYTFNANTKSITVNYGKDVLCSAETLDAFYGNVKGFSTDVPTDVNVKLTRPFAQLNIGTTNTSNDEMPAQTAVSAPVYGTLNLFTGDVEGEAAVQTFNMNKIPTANDRFPIAGVKYLAMNYLLVDTAKAIVDIAFETSDGYKTSFTNVPVKRNYRTNIHGNILKSEVGYNISIEEGINDWANEPTSALKFVDMGTGVLWATVNVGAGTPEDLGGYYAWGETSAIQSEYSWVDYDFYTGGAYHEGDKGSLMSKYNALDEFTTLLPGDDAAYSDWSKECRMPTKAEFEALITQCTWTWNEAKSGWDIAATNGNKIFLPGCPYKDGVKTFGSTNDYLYWTSTLSDETAQNAYYLEGNKSAAPTIANMVTYDRRCGMQIRPVKDLDDAETMYAIDIDNAQDLAAIEEVVSSGYDEVNIGITEDITTSATNIFHTHDATSDLNIAGNGNTITSVASSINDFSWEGGLIPSMGTVFATNGKHTLNVSNLTFNGTMSALMLGVYYPSSYRSGTIVMDNVNVIDAEVVNVNADLLLAPGVLVYNKTTTLNNCKITGTKISSLDGTAGLSCYDLVVGSGASNTVVNNCEIGTAYVWENTVKLTVGSGSTVETITIAAGEHKNGYWQSRGSLVINSGATVNVLDLSEFADKLGKDGLSLDAKVTIQDGATVGKIVANGVVYETIADFNAR